MITKQEAESLPVAAEVDILIVGGGPAGIGAALSSGRNGMSTLVIEQLNAFGGVGGAGGHGMMTTCTAHGGGQIVGGIARELLTRICEEGYGDLNASNAFYDVEWYKFMIERMFKEANVDFLYHTFFCDTVMDSNVAVGAIIQNKSGRQLVYAKRIVDCSGDGDAAAAAGCDFEKGRPSDGQCQPTTLMFMIGGVDWKKVTEWRTSYGMEEVWAEAQKNGDMEPFQKKIMGFWWNSTQPTYVGMNFTHIIDTDSTKAEDLTRATVEGRRQAFHMIPVFRKYVPGMEHCYLISTASTLGVRESRRITGEYQLTEDDIKSACRFDDSICYGSFFIDIHAIDEGGMEHTTWRPTENGFRYQIPYRCIVPRDVNNLLVAGRCISVTHVGLGSTRVMSQCTALGEAAGTASALSINAGIAPRKLSVPELQQHLRQQNCIVTEDDIDESLKNN